MPKIKLTKDDYYAYQLTGYPPAKTDPDFTEDELAFINYASDVFDYAQALMEAKDGGKFDEVSRREYRDLRAGIAAKTGIRVPADAFLETGNHSG